MKYVAFLRAVNVGGRVVKMDELRRLFTAMKLANVETFIASGNVIFDSPSRSVAALERTIGERLQAKLGYAVTTFIRSVPDLLALTAHPLFSDPALQDGTTLYVVFLGAEPGGDVARKLLTLNNDVDELHVHNRHILWLCRGSFRESRLAGPSLEKTLGMPATVRNSTTVRKLAGKYAATV
jgi:uncharacterized protein (DUF1697 family)